jgi:hypothetical protein
VNEYKLKYLAEHDRSLVIPLSDQENEKNKARTVIVNVYFTLWRRECQIRGRNFRDKNISHQKLRYN